MSLGARLKIETTLPWTARRYVLPQLEIERHLYGNVQHACKDVCNFDRHVLVHNSK